MPLRLALVEHHDLFADTLDIALTLQGHTVTRVDVPDGAQAAERLVPLVLARRPEAVVLDVDLPGHAVDAIRPLAAAGVAVIVLTGSASHARWGECLALGARRVVPKTASLQAVMGTLNRLAHGLPVIQAEHRRALIAVWHRERNQRHADRKRLALLSRREQEVLGHLVHGQALAIAAGSKAAASVHQSLVFD